MHPLIWAIHSLRKNGGTTKEAMFIKLTTTIAILFLITTTVLVILGA